VINSAIANANEGANGTVNASQMTDIAQTVQGQLAQLIQSANTNYAGVYLFGGDQTQAAPFSAAGVYAGDANTNSASFSNGAKIQVTFDGQSIFGNPTSGAIGAMTSLVAALNAGNQTAVAATIPQLNAALQQIASANSSIGTSVNNASALATNSTSAVTTINNSINQVAGADVAQVAINVQEDTAEQQALVSLASEIGKMPLINILA
jgi:flagellar hook-associated protein 3 FlgL